ncbi:MAG TPA: NAD(+) diphosphatase [Geminicoccaceae bacterium]|nr:NAD(+) diphosphatase [Geminicoccaceae bacterium]
MSEFCNPPPHRYCGVGFDRAAHRRLDAEWLSERRADPHSRVLLMSGLEILFTTADQPRVQVVPVEQLGQPLPEDALFLGEEDGFALFAADLGRTATPGCRFAEVRAVGAWLPAREAGWCAYARALAFWHSRNRYCGACGGPTVSAHGGHIRRCQTCDAQHFPRSDPAVIVLVTHRHPEHGERCLLGRSTRFPAGLYSTLAGFVEPGESLEETVCREVWEEAGVRVVDLEYRSSQPWPFPASLMLGFRARAASDALRIDPEELVDAGWFTRAQLLDPERRPVQLPNRDSIARHLIEDWLYQEEA